MAAAPGGLDEVELSSLKVIPYATSGFLQLRRIDEQSHVVTQILLRGWTGSHLVIIMLGWLITTSDPIGPHGPKMAPHRTTSGYIGLK